MTIVVPQLRDSNLKPHDYESVQRASYLNHHTTVHLFLVYTLCHDVSIYLMFFVVTCVSAGLCFFSFLSGICFGSDQKDSRTVALSGDVRSNLIWNT